MRKKNRKRYTPIKWLALHMWHFSRVKAPSYYVININERKY